MTPAQAEVWALHLEGHSGRTIATMLGKSETTVRGLLTRAKAYHEMPDGQREAIAAVRMDHATVQGGWVKTSPDENGISHSVRWKAPEVEADAPEDVLDRIADRLNRIAPAPYVKRVATPSTSLRNFIPLFDVHLSMRVGTYGTAQAVERLRTGIRHLVECSPAAECTILLNSGDFTENNDPSNLTPQSKHPLAVDAEYDDTTDVAVEVTAEMIDVALTRSDHVIYKALKGNHDPNTARILRAALKQRYRLDPRVTVETGGLEFFAHEWEGNLIGGFHGDIKRNIKDIVLGFSDRYCEMFARTKRCRELFHGHLHHELVQDVGGWRSIRVRAICPGGRHAEENLFNTPSQMSAVTYKAGGGRFGSLDHVFDPLEAFA